MQLQVVCSKKVTNVPSKSIEIAYFYKVNKQILKIIKPDWKELGKITNFSTVKMNALPNSSRVNTTNTQNSAAWG